MPIVSSTITHDNVQSDGRRAIRERHVDQVGLEYVFSYLGAAAIDAAATMAARVPGINASLISNEIARNIADVSRNGMFATITLNYSTAAANASALRAVYLNMIQAEAVMCGDYLNTLSDAQIAAAFSITTGAAATLRTNKLAPAAALAASLRASTGA
jgi:hypothetical protein